MKINQRLWMWNFGDGQMVAVEIFSNIDSVSTKYIWHDASNAPAEVKEKLRYRF